MATLKQIRQRIRTSKNIRQITRAMKLVAAARLKRAQDRVTEARPYSEKMRELMLSLSEAGGLPEHPLLEKRNVDRILLILVTADRGLKGSYNTNVIRKASDWIKEQSMPVDLYYVGKKGSQFFARRNQTTIGMHNVPTSGAGTEDGNIVTQVARDAFASGKYGSIHICFAKFYSPIRQVPQVVQVLPIEPPKSEVQAAPSNKSYEFEPDSTSLLEALLPKYLRNQVFQALLESTASEFGAQMTAMTSATDNAGKMINELTLKANRERQASITKEILEVVGGAEALKN